MFKRKNKKSDYPQMADLDGKPLQEGDVVESLRYDLGICRILKNGEAFEYESIESGERVSWAKMIDAASKNQKVRKVN